MISFVSGCTYVVSFNETAAFRFMQVSFASYCNPEAILNWSCTFCSDKAITVVRYGTLAHSITPAH